MNSQLRGIGMTSQRTRDRLVERLREGGIGHPGVLEAIRETPRHIFVDEALASRAYEDTALPIGHGQTISQPYIVARMTEHLLGDGPIDKVLEVGTGSGYQTAILARLVPDVYSVERIKDFVRVARQRFRTLELLNIRLKHTDGCWGWPTHGPYQGILVTAAPAEIPRALLEQLAIGGRLIIPLGPRGDQVLVRVTRKSMGYERTDLERVSFVPLLGGAA
jgi:protein-L-isoaspartate(D-aspartate) O-methyltransferase